MAKKLREMFSVGKNIADKELRTFGGSTGELASRFMIFRVSERPRMSTAFKRRATSSAI
jgi:hypothetical protein